MNKSELVEFYEEYGALLWDCYDISLSKLSRAHENGTLCIMPHSPERFRLVITDSKNPVDILLPTQSYVETLIDA